MATPPPPRPGPRRVAIALAVATLIGTTTAIPTLPGPAAAAPAGVAPSPLAARSSDPVVLAGADLAPLAGALPDEVVAFRWADGTWVQVPVQVDERLVVDLRTLRDGSGTVGHSALAYADPSSNAGADPDPTLDADDEVVLLGGGTGPRPPTVAADPPGTDPASRLDLAVTDPTTGAVGHVSLFTAPGLDPAAGVDLVDYAYAPTGGDAEDSWVATDRYRTRFTARWVRDVVEVAAPAGTGVDVLDRHRNLFAPGVCGRSEDTFSAGDGGFATNVDGPLRAIRSYLGANSGTYTQRQHLFYPEHERTTTFLRVHAIPGVLDLWDLAPAADGMTYRSSASPASVTVDGSPDAVVPGDLAWEHVDGAQGAIVHVHDRSTDIPGIAPTSYYADDTTPAEEQCTGDDAEWGAAGPWVATALPTTDPVDPGARTLTVHRTTAYLPGGTATAAIDQRVDELSRPLTGEVLPTFPDIGPTHPFFGEIGCMATRGWTTGYVDGTFRAIVPTSRQAALAWLWRAAGAPTGHPEAGFPDVPSEHPFHDAIAWAAAEGVTTGYEDGTFRPGAPASRQAVVTWLWRLLGEPGVGEPAAFDDVTVGHPFAHPIWWAAAVGVADGYPDGTFRGTSTVTRQAGAAFTCRALAS